MLQVEACKDLATHSAGNCSNSSTWIDVYISINQKSSWDNSVDHNPIPVRYVLLYWGVPGQGQQGKIEDNFLIDVLSCHAWIDGSKLPFRNYLTKKAQPQIGLSFKFIKLNIFLIYHFF